MIDRMLNNASAGTQVERPLCSGDIRAETVVRCTFVYVF